MNTPLSFLPSRSSLIPSPLALLFCAGAVLLAPTIGAQVKYQVIVPEVAGAPISRVQTHGNQINEAGQSLLNQVTSFSIWDDGEPSRTIEVRASNEPTLQRISAAAINASQQVVGSKTYLTKQDGSYAYVTIPFYWEANAGLVNLEDIGDISVSGLSATTLVDLNDRGLAIGSTRVYQGDQDAGSRGFVWSQDLGETAIPPAYEVDGLSATYPQALNNTNTVVGIYNHFTGSIDSYYERGFVFNSDTGTQPLHEIEPAFFKTYHNTARDINERQQIVGERDHFGYFFDLQTSEGYAIRGFGQSPSGAAASSRAYAINDLGVVAGYADVYDANGKSGTAPLLWTRQSGSLNLLDYLKQSPSSFLPSGLDILDCLIVPKRINNKAQISAQIYSASTSVSFSREIILQPVLDFNWHEIRQVVENGVPGILYQHDKTMPTPDTIAVETLGLEIAFYCSADLHSWSEIRDGQNGARLTNTNDLIELFVPLNDCTFVQPRLIPTTSDTTPL